MALLLNCSSDFSFAQTFEIKELEQKLVDIYTKFKNYSVYTNRDSLTKEINSLLPILITNKDACNLRFDSLDKFIYIISSPDNLVRVFSWDDLTGGTYRFFTNYIQFKSQHNECIIVPFDQSEESPEVAYTSIKKMVQNNKTYYFLFGSGTYGGGEKHEVVRIFEMNKDTLSECIQCYPENKLIMVRSNRGQRIEINLDIKSAELSYNQYEVNPELGVYTNKFKKITFTFINGKLIRKN